MVERDIVGGAAHLWDCIPSKSMIATGGALTFARRLEGMGLAETDADVDIASLRSRIEGITEKMQHNVTTILESQGGKTPAVESLTSVVTAAEVREMSDSIENVYVAPALRSYLLDLAEATRRHGSLSLGLSPRGVLALQRVARAQAASQGRTYATPDDVKALGRVVIPHRLLVTPEVRMRGVTGENLLVLLERRLDNIVYRLGFAPSRPAARQLVRHRHFTVNDRIVDVPSFQATPGDTIKVRDKSKRLDLIHMALKDARGTDMPWLRVDKARLEGEMLSVPTRMEIPTTAQEQLIVELYSR